ncbi:uncharacterized protein BXIN_0394 [Babesia sp. Xinjiang]|uniref:uncharacterized protein n=1 Tax=Babesia sp. Xinjiang TaxID=462227 RepID=UPI000A265D49|nr:uncharacterized protein BXIN_0394 [Babesia sp. Xinjiang]ORM41052.1 hypothetical protein BXIN_0394 [Babesia sp. Xinjiang]
MCIAKKVCTNSLRRFSISTRSRAGALMLHVRPSKGLFANNISFSSLSLAWKSRQYSSITGTDDSCDDATRASSSDTSEPLDRRTFLRLLTHVNDGNSGFVVTLQKLKDELQAEGSRAYPFRIRDLRVLAEFGAQLLALHDDEHAADVLCGAIELFKADGDASAAFHLCRLFSSFNNCLGRTLTSSVFQRVVHNRIGMMGAKYLSHSKMDKLNELNLEILDVKDVKMDIFVLTIGGKRGDNISSPYLMKQVVAHQIVVTMPKVSGSSEGITMSRQQRRDAILQTFEKGVIARMEVLLKVRQCLQLLDTDGTVVWEDPRTLSTHKLAFESEIGSLPRDVGDFEPTDWVLVDINSVLNSNAPFTATTA